VPLAAVARPHGLRGEVRLVPFNPPGDLLREVERVVVRTKAGEESTHAVRAMRPGPGGALLATLSGVDDRTAAEAIAGALVLVRRSAFPKPEPGEWYHVDLVGLRAVGPDGADVGVVERVVSYPSVDCLVVRGADGAREVPMLAPWFVDADPPAGVVRVGDLSDVPREGERS
jgi:16S rRNA processing protein RimM